MGENRDYGMHLNDNRVYWQCMKILNGTRYSTILIDKLDHNYDRVFSNSG